MTNFTTFPYKLCIRRLCPELLPNKISQFEVQIYNYNLLVFLNSYLLKLSDLIYNVWNNTDKKDRHYIIFICLCFVGL